MPNGGHHGTDLSPVRGKPIELVDLVDHECTDQSQRTQSKKCIEQESIYHEKYSPARYTSCFGYAGSDQCIRGLPGLPVQLAFLSRETDQCHGDLHSA